MRTALLAALLALAPAARAATAGTGAVLLRHPLSARSAALGGALTAEQAGTDALSSNPAGTLGISRPELLTTFISGVADDAFGFFGFSHPLPAGVLTAGLSYYDAGTVDLVGRNGAARTVSAERDFVGAVAWSMPLFGGLSAGATGKYYRMTLAQSADASGFAGDAGLQWATPLSGVRLGASVQNAGPGVRFEQASDPLPLTERAGAAWTRAAPAEVAGVPAFTAMAWTLSADAVKTRDESAAGVGAAEVSLRFGPETDATLRMSYTFSSPADGLTFGVGIREGRFTADYAIVSKRDLGNAQNVSLGVRF